MWIEVDVENLLYWCMVLFYCDGLGGVVFCWFDGDSIYYYVEDGFQYDMQNVQENFSFWVLVLEGFCLYFRQFIVTGKQIGRAHV